MTDDVLAEYREHEFKGAFPDVPTYAHIDTELLYKDDPHPFHVVLPVARVGEVSANGLLYDESLVGEIEAQLPGLGGIRGHNFDQASFPVETHDVIGHLRDGDTLWAKLYLPPGEQREEMRRRKARGGKIGTSIFGKPGKREALPHGQHRVRGLKLESLDFGPINRTAVNLGGGFAVVSELEQEPEDMDKATVIAELTISDIPQTLRDALISEYRASQDEAEQIAELRGVVTAKDARIAELEAQLTVAAVAEFNATLDGWIAEQVKVETLRPGTRRAVLAELNGSTDTEQAKQVLAQYLEGAEYQALAKAMVAELAGPSAIVTGQGATSTDWREQLISNSGQIAKEIGVL